jgi:DNA-binding MarR family transcriptional regulator
MVTQDCRNLQRLSCQSTCRAWRGEDIAEEVGLLPPKRDSRRPSDAWLTARQSRAWIAYMKVQLRMSYEMNRQLQADSGLSLSDYDVLVALGGAPQGRMQVAELAAQIGWERSRVSHHLRRMGERELVERRTSAADARATDITLTDQGRQALDSAAPGHVALVRRLFFDPLPDELIAPLTAALEHINVNLNLNGSLPSAPG